MQFNRAEVGPSNGTRDTIFQTSPRRPSGLVRKFLAAVVRRALSPHGCELHLKQVEIIRG